MSAPAIHITVLGSGTSAGVPTIGCGCAVCASSDPRDKRLRPSILVRFDQPGGERAVLIDTTPDFRAQALRAHIERIDAILYTHSHADHILGLDDVRPFNYRQRQAIPLYGTAATLDAIQRVFCYAFEDAPAGTAIPRLNLNPLDGAIRSICSGWSSRRFRCCTANRRFWDSASARPPISPITARFRKRPRRSCTGLDVLFLDALAASPASHAFDRRAEPRYGWRN